MKKYIVYLTVNTVNNKIYVGVHGTETPDKFDNYLGNGIFSNRPSTIAHPTTPFHYAVKKYGFKSFKRSTLAVFDNIQDALDMEEDIVNEDFIKRNDTYNITIGGGMPPILNKKVYQYSLKGIFIKEYFSEKEALESIGSKSKNGSGGLSIAIYFKRTAFNYLWSFEKLDKLDISEYNIYSPKVFVYLYDSDGSFIKKYSGMAECARSLQASLSHIQRSIKLGVKTKGYYISDKLYNVYQKPEVNKLKGKVHQYSLEGIYLKSYNSIKEVSEFFGESMDGINTSIKLGQQYKGYLWLRGEKYDSIKPYITPKCSAKKIGQYDSFNNLIRVFSTVREARKEFPNVSKVLNGSAKHCHNYIFKYLD